VFTYVYSHYALCLLLQILFVAALDINTRYVPTVSSINSLLSQYCKASHFLAHFYVWGAPTVRFAPVVPWAKAGPGRLSWRLLLYLIFFYHQFIVLYLVSLFFLASYTKLLLGVRQNQKVYCIGKSFP
jgi:hypothetical protein